MEKLTIEEIITSVKGEIIKKNFLNDIEYISTDSRDIRNNTLFISLVGEKFDGHNFIKECYEKGSRAFIIEKDIDIEYENITLIKVPNTLYALGDIAKFYRNKFDVEVIGVTGSVGKTSTKDIIHSVLSKKYNTLKNEGNFNNEIGLPKTIFNISSLNEYAVLEMGMDHKGQIKHMADIAHPTIGVISNIGSAHIEFFDSKDGIFNAKMEITTYFDENSLLIINGDDSYLKTLLSKKHKYKILSYGFNHYNDIYPLEYKINDDNSTFTCLINNKKEYFTIPSPAKHNILNALSAILIGLYKKVPLDKIKEGLSTFTLSKSRMDIFKTDKYKIINDTYNASLDSVVAGLEVLKNNNTRRVAILGDIFEVGKFEETIHREIGKHIKGNADILVTVGNASKYILESALEEGFDKNNTYHYIDRFSLLKEINNIVKENDTILIKASNGMKLEEVSNYFRNL